MEHHVFAVWDFMSLVTRLRTDLTCTRVPWVPRGPASVRRFVNELAMSEDSDEGPNGGYSSHFEVYLDAMDQCGADSRPMRSLLAALEAGTEVTQALTRCEGPAGAVAFAATTYEMSAVGTLPEVVGAFAFGRESLIPSMFQNVRSLLSSSPDLSLFDWYLDRHIDLDGNEHTPMAFELVTDVCGDDPDRWTMCEDAARRALAERSSLWDCASEAMSPSTLAPQASSFSRSARTPHLRS